MKSFRKYLGMVSLGGVIALGGCSSTSSDAMSVRLEPSPELTTLYERPSDVYNNLAIMVDENERMFWEDLGRAFYWDRPSRLTPEPMPR